jgi:hypothetical protein
MGQGGATIAGVCALAVSCALPAAAQPQQADLLRLSTQHGDIAVVGRTETGGGRTTVQTRTTLETRREAFTGRIDFTMDAGRSSVDAVALSLDQRSWRAERLDVRTSFEPLSALKLDLTAAHQQRQDLRVDPLAPPDTRAADVQASETAAGLSARFTVTPRLHLDLAGQARSTVSEEATGRTLAVLDSEQSTLTASLNWVLHPKLTLRARSAVRELDVAWRSEGSGPLRREDSFQYAEPQLAAVVSVWDGARLEVETGRAVEALNNGDFIALARVAGDTSDVRVEPTREWRTRAGLSKTLFDRLQLDAAYAVAALEGVTEFSALGVAASVDEGRRDQAELRLSLPLRGPDLSTVSLTSSGVWRGSEVRDPLTGDFRRRSGEAPFEARLGVVQEMRGGRFRWGVDGGWTGEQSYYGLDVAKTAEGYSRWGAFVERRHHELVLRLQLDNAGTSRGFEEVRYGGPRGAAEAVSVGRGETAPAQAIRLSLKRAL